jgi:hypothetical protein
MNAVARAPDFPRTTRVREVPENRTGPTRSGVAPTVLLVCGILSSLLYGAMITLIRYEGYNPISQVPSELTAIGAPTRPFWMVLGPVYDLLVVAFGVGVWMSADRKRALRIVGGLFVGFGILGALAWPFAAMHQREVLAAGGGTWSGTLHVILGLMTVLFMLVAIGFGAATFGKAFRLYSIVTILILFVFGALTGLESPRLQANLPTPWIGLWERINIGAFLLWVVVLAIALLRTHGTMVTGMSSISTRQTFAA